MRTDFKGLDKIINLNEPEMVAFSGSVLVDILTGDIANNICLSQNCEVLEIVSQRKEYLIKRLVINQSNVNYKDWYLKKYDNKELQQIALAAMNLFDSFKRLPTIIETNTMNLKDIKKYIKNYANHYADKKIIDTLIVLDIFPLNNVYVLKNNKYNKKYEKEGLRFIKSMSKICKNLRCPIIFTYLGDIKKIFKYVDKIVVASYNESKNGILNLKVLCNNKKIDTCNIKYNFYLRRFEDV